MRTFVQVLIINALDRTFGVQKKYGIVHFDPKKVHSYIRAQKCKKSTAVTLSFSVALATSVLLYFYFHYHCTQEKKIYIVVFHVELNSCIIMR